MKINKRLLVIAVPAILVLLGLVFYDYVYLGVQSELSSIREQQDAKMKTLAKYVNLIAEKPNMEKQLAALKEQADAQKVRFIEGDSITLASANLQGIVKGIVTARGGTVSSERVGKPEDLEKTPAQVPGTAAAQKNAPAKKTEKPAERSRLQVLTVSIDATVPDIAALNDILYSIESRTPDLVLKELDVRVKNFREPRELMVKIDVSGLYGGK